MRLIDADALKYKLIRELNKTGKYTPYECGLDDALSYVNEQPTIEAEPVKWIPVTERLPEENHDGSVNAVLVTDGFVQHMAYFARGEWRFAESGEIKEPMWYSITHWMPLPKPPEDGGADHG